MHLLRLLSGGLPGRCHRRGSELWVLDGDPRGASLQQGEAVEQRRQVGGRDRRQHRSRLSLSMKWWFLRKCWRWTSVKNKAIPSVVVLTITLVFLFSSPHKDRLSVGMSELSPHWWIGTAQCYILRESPRVVCVLLVCTLHFPSSTKRLLVERTQVPPANRFLFCSFKWCFLFTGFGNLTDVFHWWNSGNRTWAARGINYLTRGFENIGSRCKNFSG